MAFGRSAGRLRFSEADVRVGWNTPFVVSFEEAVNRSREAKLVDFVGEVEAAALSDRAQLIHAIIDGLARVVPCDRVVCADGDMTGTTSSEPGFQAFRQVHMSAWKTFEWQHPKLVHWSRTGDGAAVRFSDLISRRALHRLPIYDHFWRPFEVEYDVGVRIESGPAHRTDLSCTRSGKDFSDEERDLLEALRPYLARLLQHVDARRSAQTLRTRFGIGRREAEVLGLVARGKTNQEIAATLFLSAGTVRKHLEHIYTKLGAATRTQAALTALEALEARTRVDGPHAKTQDASINPFGLTSRESQILTILAEGKSNTEIATELAVSPQTVKKHLDHIYIKLDVRGRTDAAVRARLDWRLPQFARPEEEHVR